MMRIGDHLSNYFKKTRGAEPTKINELTVAVFKYRAESEKPYE
jgi:hypothetical protein